MDKKDDADLKDEDMHYELIQSFFRDKRTYRRRWKPSSHRRRQIRRQTTTSYVPCMMIDKFDF